MKKYLPFALPLALALIINPTNKNSEVLSTEIYNPTSVTENISNEHWFILHRQSEIEELYFGEPGNKEKSLLIKNFKVKAGVADKKPTPLPTLLERDYWLITHKFDLSDNTEIGPYFLKLDIPYSDNPPYGPNPYPECDGECNWELPGSFGLHGIAGDESKLEDENEGSSGCVRHSDEDIRLLYNLLDLDNKEIRYYIDDN